MAFRQVSNPADQGQIPCGERHAATESHALYNPFDEQFPPLLHRLGEEGTTVRSPSML